MGLMIDWKEKQKALETLSNLKLKVVNRSSRAQYHTVLARDKHRQMSRAGFRYNYTMKRFFNNISGCVVIVLFIYTAAYKFNCEIAVMV